MLFTLSVSRWGGLQPAADFKMFRQSGLKPAAD